MRSREHRLTLAKWRKSTRHVAKKTMIYFTWHEGEGNMRRASCPCD